MCAMILPFRGLAPKIHPEAFVAETAVLIGDVEVGAGSSIWYGCVLRGDLNAIRVGRNSNLQDGTIVHVNSDRSGQDYRVHGGGMPTHIGDHVTVGHMALIHACTLESGCFVGMRAVVLDGARVEGRAMVAAGAVVSPNKVVPAGQLWAGLPAKHRRDLGDADYEDFHYVASVYGDLGVEYRAAGHDNRGT